MAGMLRKTGWKDSNAGVFAAFIPGLKDGDCYKYQINGFDSQTVLKSDTVSPVSCRGSPGDGLKGLEP